MTATGLKTSSAAPRQHSVIIVARHRTTLPNAAVMRRHLTDDQRAMIAAKWAQENKQSPPGVT